MPGAVLVLAVGCWPQAAGAQAPQSIRLLSYNTAHLYVEARSNLPVPPPPPQLCFACNPVEIPPVGLLGPCLCYPTMSIEPNAGRFAPISEADRALRIALEILDSDQEVVVLNEVWHPKARQQFVQILAGIGLYDHYISLLAGHPPKEGTVTDFFAEGSSEVVKELLEAIPDFLNYQAVPGDSGLMIFSKHPFQPLQGNAVPNDAVCGDPVCKFAGKNDGGPLLPGFFAFKVFPDCDGEDCWASKGVGLVRTRGGYVAFTHLQADYKDGSPPNHEVRFKQYATIHQTLRDSIPAIQLRQVPIYVAGDLNTVGASREAPAATAEEWHRVFDPASIQPNVAAGFFACGNGVDTGGKPGICAHAPSRPFTLTESWGFETSPTDAGITNHDDVARLDYLLHSHLLGRLCMQHAMIAWELRADTDGSGGLTWLSDHLPIRGDFSFRNGRYCSPNSEFLSPPLQKNSRLLTFGPTNCTEGGAGGNPACDQDESIAPPAARLANAGAYQWFRIEVAGTYSIRLTPTDPTKRVSYVVYHHSDLSRPLAPFDPDEGELGLTFTMPDPPYYIRTFAVDAAQEPDRTIADARYTLDVHQHLCRSPQDACAIDPGRARHHPTAYTFPTTTSSPLTEVRDLYWRFKTGGVRAGRLVGPADDDASFPRVRMHIETSDEEKLECLTRVEPAIELWDDHLAPTQRLAEIAFVETQVDDDGDWDQDGVGPDELRRAPPLPGKASDLMETYFLRLTRDSSYLAQFEECNLGMQAFIGYLTDLTYLVPVQLRLWAQSDDGLDAVSPPDHLRIFPGFDLAGWLPFVPAQGSVEKVLAEPDSGAATTSLLGYGDLRGYYVGRAWPHLFEKHQGRRLAVWAPISGFQGIEPLSDWLPSHGCVGLTCDSPADDGLLTEPTPFLEYSDGPNADEADYYDYLYYARCHHENELACKAP